MQVDREGEFRGVISAYGIYNAESGALGISLVGDLQDLWQPPADGADGYWCPWGEYQMQAEGTVWIVKKDGTPNLAGIESLCKYAGWDGELSSIAEESWQPTPARMSVKKESYEGKERFKLAFLNDFNREPGSKGNVDPDKARELQTRFGSHFKAIAGTVAQSKSPPPAGKPSSPKRPAAGVPANQASNARKAAAETGEQVPF